MLDASKSILWMMLIPSFISIAIGIIMSISMKKSKIGATLVAAGILFVIVAIATILPLL